MQAPCRRGNAATKDPPMRSVDTPEAECLRGHWLYSVSLTGCLLRGLLELMGSACTS